MAEKKLTFEQALKRLDEIVSSLDNGTAELDKSLDLFEEGVKLVKFCQKSLDDAERKVNLVKLGKDEKVEETPFTPKSEAK